MRRSGLIGVALLALAGAGCGQLRAGAEPAAQAAGHAYSADPSPLSVHAHPQAIEPEAGVGAPAGSGAGSVAPAGSSAGSVAPAGSAAGSVAPAGSSAGSVAPAGSGAGAAPGAISVGSSDNGLAHPISDAEVRAELTASGRSASLNQATLTLGGLAIAPMDAPPAVQDVIAAGNEIARLPYRYGGGHVTYEDTAYDCSGSISFVFAAAHLLNGTVVSGDLMNWGALGPGRWITVFANAGHTFMYVAGLRFDTVALAQTGSRWSDRSADEPDLSTFAIRHPRGL